MTTNFDSDVVGTLNFDSVIVETLSSDFGNVEILDFNGLRTGEGASNFVLDFMGALNFETFDSDSNFVSLSVSRASSRKESTLESSSSLLMRSMTSQPEELTSVLKIYYISGY
jgi:hypothetical protein